MTVDAKPGACDVRPVEREDLQQLVSMCAEHARYERSPYDPSGKARALGRVLFDTPPRLSAWIAELHGTPVGYVTASAEFSTWAAREYIHMDCLFVREGHRGKGIGAALLAVLVRFARERGYAELQWQTPTWNVEAERFYLRQGALGQAKIRFTLSSATAGTASVRD